MGIAKKKKKKKKEVPCVIGMGCMILDGKLITCSLEIIEIMLLIPCVMPIFKRKKTLPCQFSKHKRKEKKRKSITDQQWSQPLDYYCYKSKFLDVSMGLVGRWLELGHLLLQCCTKSKCNQQTSPILPLLYVITYVHFISVQSWLPQD